MPIPGIKTKASELVSSGTPLRKFKGKLDAIVPRPDPQNNRMMVGLQFTELSQVESVTPYIYPVAELKVKYSDNDRSVWGMLIKSGEELGLPDLEQGIGKYLTMVCDPEFVFGPDRQNPGANITGTVWTVTAVDGLAGPTASGATSQSILLGLIHGKDAGQFAQLALNSTELRQMSDFQQVSGSIFDGSLIAAMIATEKIQKEGEKYWVVGRPRE